MKNKEKLIEISQAIRSSDLRKASKFVELIENLSKTSTKDLYEKIVELCLQHNIDCQELINKSVEYKESKLSEDDFRQMLYIVLV